MSDSRQRRKKLVVPIALAVALLADAAGSAIGQQVPDASVRDAGIADAGIPDARRDPDAPHAPIEEGGGGCACVPAS